MNLDLMQVLSFDAFGANVDSLGMAFDENTHFLKVRQEFTHAPAGDLAACSALGFILSFSGNDFSG